MAVFEGMDTQIIKAVVEGNVGHLQVQSSHYHQASSPQQPEKLDQSLISQLQNPVVAAYSDELVLKGFISAPEGQQSLDVIGVDLQKHYHTFALMDKKSYLSIAKEGVLIGKALAQKFSYELGDQLMINFQNAQGDLQSELFTIKGIFHKNGLSFEKNHLYLTKKNWLKIYGIDHDAQLFNRIAILLKSRFHKLKLSDKFLQRSWREINPEMAVVLDFHSGMIRFFMLIIAITVLMTVLNPVSILWQERFNEFKMLNTIGVNKKTFWRLGLTEGFIVSLIASFFSFSLLSALLFYQSKSGLNFSKLNAGNTIERAGIQLPRYVYPLMEWEVFYAIVLLVIFVVMTSYAYGIYGLIKKIEKEMK